MISSAKKVTTVIIAIFVLVIVFGLIISRKGNSFVSISTTPTPFDSRTFLSKVGLEMNLPTELFYYQPLIEVETNQPGVNGTNYCLTFTHTYVKKQVLPCGENDIEGGATSSDFDGGREISLFDAQGYVYKNNKYFLKSFGSESEIDISQNPLQEMTSDYGVKILLIKPEENIPEGGYLGPQKGYEAAVFNTKSSHYPGFVILAKISNSVTEEVFKKWLSSFQYK